MFGSENAGVTPRRVLSARRGLGGATQTPVAKKFGGGSGANATPRRALGPVANGGKLALGLSGGGENGRVGLGGAAKGAKRFGVSRGNTGLKSAGKTVAESAGYGEIQVRVRV